MFGGWAFKLMHIPSSLGFIILQIFDLIPFAIFLVDGVLIRSKRFLPNTFSFWNVLSIFFILSLATTILHNGSAFRSIGHFAAMFRYVPLASLIIRHANNESDINKFLIHFKSISLVLVLIGYLEVFGGSSVKDFFSPLTSSYSSSNKAFDIFNIPGIFPNTVDYSCFILISFIILSCSKYSIFNIKGITFYLIPLFCSGSKAALIIFILFIYIRMKNRIILRNTIAFLFLTICIYLTYEFWDLLYWTIFVDSKASRLGYLIYTLPDFLIDFSFDTFLGCSPDYDIVHDKINSFPNAPLMTWSIDAMTSFEDEFYVALVVYYGIIGFMVLLYLYMRLFHSMYMLKWRNHILNYKQIVTGLLLCIIIFPLFNQVIIIKTFALFFWIMVGIIVSQSSYTTKLYNKSCTSIS